jgi:hypothetical protein
LSENPAEVTEEEGHETPKAGTKLSSQRKPYLLDKGAVPVLSLSSRDRTSKNGALRVLLLLSMLAVIGGVVVFAALTPASPRRPYTEDRRRDLDMRRRWP